MARGRMINNKITRNKAINDLSDDTSRLAYTWLVTFADVEGRTNGDPALVRSLVFPRRTDVSVARMEAYIREWAAAGLVVWYEADGDLWISFPAFAENQRGLDRRKEPYSEIPAPPEIVPGTDSVRTAYVPDTAEENSREDKEKRRESSGAVAEAASTAPDPATESQVITSSEEEGPPAPNRRSDPRSRHPAIVAARAVTGAKHYPPLELYDGLITALGENPDAERLKTCRQAWIERGYNPRAWTWATEWYTQGVPAKGARASPSGSGNGKNAYFNDPEVYARAGREWDATK